MGNYAKGDGGYRLPAITDPERICIKLEIPNDPDHKQAFWGALWTLTWYTAWQKDDDKRGKDVAAVWRDVWFKARAANVDWDACLDCPDENGCVEYSPQYIQEWIPNNPYIDPPAAVGWYIAPSINLLGVPAGTVVTDLLLLPAPNPATTRCRFYFSGTGTVEIHWHTINGGGQAQVQVDDDVFQLSYIDLSSDLSSIPPEYPAPIQTEYDFTVPGEHHIDITMLPVLNTDIEFLGYGGGIVKIVLCGFDTMIITPQFRFTAECGLEQSNDSGATWNSVPGWDTYAEDCFIGPAGTPGTPGTPGTDGADGADGEDGEDCECENVDPRPPTESDNDDDCSVALAWADYAKVQFDFLIDNPTMIAQLVSGGINLGGTALLLYPAVTLAGISGSVLLLLAGAIIAVVAPAIAGSVKAQFSADVLEAMRRAAYCAMQAKPEGEGLGILPADVGNFITLASIDDPHTGPISWFLPYLAQVPLDLWKFQAAAAAQTVGNPCAEYNCPPDVEYDWCVVWDFAIDDYSFAVAFAPQTYDAGTGWKAGLTTAFQIVTRSLEVSRSFGNGLGSNGVTVVAARVVTVGTKGSAGSGDAIFTVKTGNTVADATSWSDWEARTKTIVYDTPKTVNRVGFSVLVSNSTGAGASDKGGDGWLKSVALYGTGTPPAWTETPEC